MTGRQYFGQKGQDQWIVEEVFPGKRNGWFLDLAATDGQTLSNTLVLEREFGWSGLAIEPNPASFELLQQKRTCHTCSSCIDADFGTVEFLPNRELGGIISDDTDNALAIRPSLIKEWRESGKTLTVPTMPLAHVLDQYNAPAVIDFFSFDVEGAETRILRNFPFTRYRFMAMCIERPTLELNALLFHHGYAFVRNRQFDSFYVHESLPSIGILARDKFEQVPKKDW
ncbi:MAG TPA: FkbM family methyltransferase [Rhizomicrobium sp.]